MFLYKGTFLDKDIQTVQQYSAHLHKEVKYPKM